LRSAETSTLLLQLFERHWSATQKVVQVV
jgi:hypothetical protein